MTNVSTAAMRDPEHIARALGVEGKSEVLHLCRGGVHSWVIHAPGFWDLSAQRVEEVWGNHPEEFVKFKMFGKEVQAPRWQMFYSDTVNYAFSGFSQKERMLGDLEECESFARSTEDCLGVGRGTFNGCMVNWYGAGMGHYIGAHKDDEKSMVAGAPIFSMTWGATRRFRFTYDPKWDRSGMIPITNIVESVTLSLAHGDLVVMGGDCQRTHKHEVPKPKKSEDQGRRINMTLRAFWTKGAQHPEKRKRE